MSEFVTFQTQDSYSVITMDDGKANALGFDMLSQLHAALDRAEAAGSVTIMAGRPGKFSAGFDLAVMGQGGDDREKLLREGARLSRRMLEFPCPLILAISGHALAMGGLLMLSADYRIGIQGPYKLGLNEVLIGMTMPYFGVSLARARLAPAHFDNAVGLARIYDPEGAVAAGYLDEVVEAEQLMPRAIELAHQLSALDMNAHRQSKARVREALLSELDAAFEREAQAR